MKSISKAMIAVMIAAAMCAVPLFIAADSEAAGSFKESSSGVSFKASSVSETDFKNLVSEGYLNYLARGTLAGVVSDSTDWALSEVAVTGNVKDIRLAEGMDVKSESIKIVDASSITFHIKFKATFTASMFTPTTQLFADLEGNEDLYKELGTNEAADGTVLIIEGDVTMDEYKSVEGKYIKTSENNYVAKEIDMKDSESLKCDGSVNVTNLEKKYELKTESSQGGSGTITFDYYKADKVEDVTATSKVMLESKVDGNPGQKMVFKYTVSGKSGGYDTTVTDGGMPKTFFTGTVEDINLMVMGMYGLPSYITTEVEAEKFYFYDSAINDDSLFNEYIVNPDKDLKSNDKMKAALDKAGDVGETFSDADSVANGAYSSVNGSGSSSGGSNVIFYVIIGVLAVAVVALAVLMIKKK